MQPNAFSLCLPSFMITFEGGHLDLRAQSIVGWFLTPRCYISKMVRDRAKVTINQLITNRKSYVGFRLQQKSIILNDLERGRNGRLLSVVLTSCYCPGSGGSQNLVTGLFVHPIHNNHVNNEILLTYFITACCDLIELDFDAQVLWYFEFCKHFAAECSSFLDCILFYYGRGCIDRLQSCHINIWQNQLSYICHCITWICDSSLTLTWPLPTDGWIYLYCN